MFNYFRQLFLRIKRWFIRIGGRKHVLDYIIAIITIPVLLTLLITNILNLQSKNKKETDSKETKVIIQNETTTPTKTEQIIITSEACKKEIGPISITYPKENEEVNDDPLCITIKHDNETYCTVVWSYRINNGKWSDYSSNSVCLYNVPDGDVKFELRVQSTVSDDQDTLDRNFVYKATGEEKATNSAETN